MRRTPVRGSHSWHTRSMSAADSTRAKSASPVGGNNALGPETRCTRAPRRAAAAASAYPMRPLERLPTKRTGSMASHVPAAVTSTSKSASARDSLRGEDGCPAAEPPAFAARDEGVPPVAAACDEGEPPVAAACDEGERPGLAVCDDAEP